MEKTCAVVACMGILLGALYISKRDRTSRKRKYKVRPINRNRLNLGFFTTTFLPMKDEDPGQFFKYTRMTQNVFNQLLCLISPQMVKKELPDSISSEQRLAMTLQ